MIYCACLIDIDVWLFINAWYLFSIKNSVIEELIINLLTNRSCEINATDKKKGYNCWKT